METKETKGLSKEEMAEIGANAVSEIMEQFKSCANNSFKIAKNFEDILAYAEFGIVSCAMIGDEVIYSQILGRKKQCKEAILELINSVHQQEE